jgi:hypothetical protein
MGGQPRRIDEDTGKRHNDTRCTDRTPFGKPTRFQTARMVHGGQNKGYAGTPSRIHSSMTLHSPAGAHDQCRVQRTMLLWRVGRKGGGARTLQIHSVLPQLHSVLPAPTVSGGDHRGVLTNWQDQEKPRGPHKHEMLGESTPTIVRNPT